MSKEIGVFHGSYEARHDPEKLVTIYNDADLFLTSFYGGVERGPCIQFTVHGGELAYVQLNRDDISRLRDVLAEWLRKH